MTKQQYTAICQTWSYYERGEIPESCGFSLHISEEDRKSFISKFMSKLPHEVPNSYIYPTHNIFSENPSHTPQAVKKSIYNKIEKSECGLHFYGTLEDLLKTKGAPSGRGAEALAELSIDPLAEIEDSTHDPIIFPKNARGKLKEYIVIFWKNDGGWHSGDYDHTPTFTFSAKNDEQALVLAKAFAQKKRDEYPNSREEWDIQELRQIEVHMKTQEIPLEFEEKQVTSLKGVNIPIIELPHNAIEKARFEKLELDSLLKSST